MYPKHPDWDEFICRLIGPEGCNFPDKPPADNGKMAWRCKGGTDKTYAKKILKKMGFSKDDIEDSCTYFDGAGGMCDCEIFFNVDR